jgi:hypothetical protein
MSTVEADFKQRCEEVERYLDYLRGLEVAAGADVNLMATMKASAMLMIYNVVESTMANAIESIFDRLRSENIGFISIDDKLKAMVLKCAKEQNPTKLVTKMRDELLDLAVAAFRKDSVFSGNVDAHKIREILDECGVKRSGSYKESALLEIKGARNNLAHGSKSFSELGRTMTAADLDKKHKAVKTLLSNVIKDVKFHVENCLHKQVAA